MTEASQLRRLTAVAGGSACALTLLGALLWEPEAGVVLTFWERLQVGLSLGGVGGLLAVGASLGVSRAWPAAREVSVQARFSGAIALGLGVPLGLAVLNGLAPGGADAVGVLPVLGVLLGLVVLAVVARSRLGVLALVGVSGGTLAVLNASPERRSGAAELMGPDIWIITLDTVRADHLDFNGGTGPHAHTPVLSALASRSTVYTQAFSPAAYTGPAHASLLSGEGTETHGVVMNGQALPGEGPWLPSLLQESGWVCRALVSAAVLDEGLGFGRGFDSFDGTFSGRVLAGHPALRFLGRQEGERGPAERAGSDTIALLGALPGSAPHLTWVHLYDAHWPYHPSAAAAARQGLDDPTPLEDDEEQGVRRLPGPQARALDPAVVERGKTLYRAGLEDLDALVGQILQGVPDEAVLIVVGDHGESLDEHDYHFSHGRLPYAPDTQVPLLVRLPGAPPGRVDTPVSLVDIAPTVLTAVGLPVPEAMEGAPLQSLPAARTVSTLTPVALLERLGGGRQQGRGALAGAALRDGHRSWIWTREEGYRSTLRDADPRELHLVPMEANDPQRQALEALLAAAGEVPPAAVEPEALEALESLGYLPGPVEPDGPRGDARSPESAAPARVREARP